MFNISKKFIFQDEDDEEDEEDAPEEGFEEHADNADSTTQDLYRAYRPKFPINQEFDYLLFNLIKFPFFSFCKVI